MTVRDLIDGNIDFDVPFKLFCWHVDTRDRECYGDYVGNDQEVPEKYMDLDIVRIRLGNDGDLEIECIDFIKED